MKRKLGGTAATRLYENCIIFNIDGSHLKYTNKSRLNNLVELGFAKFVDENSIILVKELKLSPNNAMRNECAVCGYKEYLNRHHVVPICFFRHFTFEEKFSFPQNILPICLECHNKYEYHASDFKNRLAKEHGFIQVNLPKEASKAKLFAKRILAGSNNPDYWEHIKKFLNKQEISQEELINLKNLKVSLEETMEYKLFKAIGVKDLISIWKHHFVYYMKPKFLPECWNV